MLKLSFTIEAVDRATRAVRSVNTSIEKLTEGPRRLRASFRSLWTEAGAGRITQSWRSLSGAAGDLLGQVKGLAAQFAVVGAVGAVAFLPIKNVIDEAGKLSDLSAGMGVSTEFLQKVGYAAKLSGGSVEDAGESLKFLQKNAVEALTGNKDTAQWFQRAGISADFLAKNLKDPEKLFLKLADGIAATDNPAKQVAMSTALAGRGVARMLPSLKGGSKGFAEIGKEAERLGGVLDGDTVAAMDGVGDRMDSLGFTIGGVFKMVTAIALPTIDKIVVGFREWIVANRGLIKTKVTAFVEAFAARLPAIVQGIGALGSAIGTVIGVVDRVAQFMGGWEVVLGAIAALMGLKLIVSVVSLASAVYGLGAALWMTPLGWFVLGVTAVAAIAILLVRKWEPIKAFFSNLWEGVKAAFDAGWTWISSIVSNITGAISRVADAMPPWLVNLLGKGAALVAGTVKSIASPGAPAVPAAAPRGPAVGGAIAPGSGRADVGGTLRIEFAGQTPGQPKVTRSKPNGALDFDVYAGASMMTP